MIFNFGAKGSCVAGTSVLSSLACSFNLTSVQHGFSYSLVSTPVHKLTLLIRWPRQPVQAA